MLCLTLFEGKQMSQIERIQESLRDVSRIPAIQNAELSPFGAKTPASILFGHPWFKTQEAGIYWLIRVATLAWVARCGWRHLYNSGYLAVLPMDFYFPGHGKSGDLHFAQVSRSTYPATCKEPVLISTNSLDWAMSASYLQEISGKADRESKTLLQNHYQPIFLSSSPFSCNQI